MPGLTPTSEPAGRIARWLEDAQEDSLTLSYWFRPDVAWAAHPVIIRFSGQRVGTGTRTTARDQFVHEETVDGSVMGAGAVCVTARVRGINAGEWRVSAVAVDPARTRGAGARASSALLPIGVRRAAWSWRTRRLSEAADSPVETGPWVFASAPGIVPGSWAMMVALAVTIGVTSLAFTAHAVGDAGPVLVLTVAALVAGAIGAKTWFVALHRRERRAEGWCIQGFMTGVLLAVAIAVAVAGVPAGVYLDAAAPGLLFAVAIGRIGCFFAGCCAGRPTTRWWGIWSSDCRIGVRRVPTQLLESLMAVVVGVGALVVVLGIGTAHGGVLAASLALYTLLRQLILRMRSERRQSTIGSPLVAGAAMAVFVVDVGLHALGVLGTLGGA